MKSHDHSAIEYTKSVSVVKEIEAGRRVRPRDIFQLFFSVCYLVIEGHIKLNMALNVKGYV